MAEPGTSEPVFIDLIPEQSLPSPIELFKQLAETPVEKISLRESEGGIAVWRRCPLCWGDEQNGNRGYGVAYSTQGLTRYYRCVKTLNKEKPPCGHTWSCNINQHTLDVLKIEYRTVILSERSE